MSKFTLTELQKCTQGNIIQDVFDEFTDISTDTRTIREGMVFLALHGENFDGHNFLMQAAAAGAKCVIVDEKFPLRQDYAISVLQVKDTLQAYIDIAAYWRKKFSMPVIAVTGSNGKTTTKDLTAAILSSRYRVLKTEKNYNSEIGLARTLLQMSANQDMTVVEIGMRGLGQIERLAKAALPEVGIVLNVGTVHMELLGSRENIAKAKAELVEALPISGTAIINIDDEYVAKMAKMTPAQNIITFSLKKEANIRAISWEIREETYTDFICEIFGERAHFSLPLLGKHNLYDALAAIATAYKYGLSIEEMQRGLKTFQPPKERFERKVVGNYRLVDDAYNASPASVEAALQNFMLLKARKKIFVFGDMKELGKEEIEAHQLVGKLAVKYHVDILITLGDLAAYAVIAANEIGLEQTYACSSHQEIANLLKKLAAKEDIILLKGSHSMSMPKIMDLLVV